MTLQYCVGLCHTSTWISHRYTFVPSLLKPLLSLTWSHPSRLSQNTGLSSLCHTADATCYFTYGSVCVSMLFSQFAPLFPPPSHCVHKSVLYICVSIPSLKTVSSILFFQIPYVCINIQYLLFSFWLTSLYITGSKFIHLTRTNSNLFFFVLSNSPLHICTTSSLSIHL